ncbi:MAG: FkbM family methyltransferase [Alphaproteobacteria bacterium]
MRQSELEPIGPSEADEYVRWAYRLLLGREPESERTVSDNALKYDRQQLLCSVLLSQEFQAANPFISCDALAAAPAMDVPKDVHEAIGHGYDEVALVHDYQRLDQAQKAWLLAMLRNLHGAALTCPWEQELTRTTTQADIAALFRLVLGRNPQPAEWNSHLAFELGRDSQEITRRFLSSWEFNQRGLLRRTAPSAIERTSIEGFEIFAARDDNAVGAHVLGGSYEPNVTAVFRRYLRPGMQVIDVGANIGYFTMLAASIVGPDGLVTAVEANPDNAKLIEASRRINNCSHIRIANVATGREIGLLSLYNDYSNGVTSSISGMDDLWDARVVPCVPLQHLIPPDRRIDFIKIDIEGAEYLALSAIKETLRQDRPTIVSEFSPYFLTSVSGVTAERYLGFFLECGLELGVIDPEGGIVTFGSDVAGVIGAWEATGWDHIDIVATPSLPG